MNYTYGLKKGLPIALGYLSVSFGFGISAVNSGLMPWQAVLISLFNLTSAGQQAGVAVMAAWGTVLEMTVTQLVINLRYSLMGIALTQKLDSGFGAIHRIVTAFGITDEVFAVSASEDKRLTPSYMYGIISLPVIGWTLGTALGAYAGQILPASLCSALCLAIYAMFVAIVVPPAKEHRGVLCTLLLSVALSCVLYYVPVLKAHISQGFAIIICAVTASALMAWLMPRGEEGNGNE